MRKRTRMLALFLCVVMLISVFPTSVFAAEPLPFKDVKAGSWYYDDVAYVYEHELMNGVGNNLFAPSASTSRAMIVTILYRVEGSPATNKKTTFKDLKSGSWYYDAVKWAAENKIVNGYSDTKFGPSEDITREQFASILYRYAQFKGYDLSKRADLSAYSDAKKVSSWAKEAMSWANAMDLIHGTGQALDPRGAATRAQAAAILHRFLENVPPKAPVALTVTFDLNYEGSPENTNVEVKSGSKVAQPKTPVRSGYDFAGWFLSQTNGEKFNFDTAVTENLLLFAQWTEAAPVADDGDKDKDKDIDKDKDSTPIEIDDPDDDDDDEDVDLPDNPDTEEPELEDNYYNVVFMPNNGTDGVVDMQTVRGGMKAEKPDDPTWEGYAFTGWYEDTALLNPYNFNKPVRGDLFLYAGWGNPDGTDGAYGASTGGGTDFSITDIQAVNGGFAVTVNTNYAAVLVVEIIDEESGELVTTGAAETPDYCELEQVFVAVSNLPEHFDIRVSLLDENGEELCNPYTTVRFTSAYEVYDAKTIYDFEGETVINFDSAPDANFGVLADNVKMIDTGNGKNKIEAAYDEIRDEDDLVTEYVLTGYWISDPDQSVIGLQSGDIIYIVDTSGVPLLFKIGTVEQRDGKLFVTQDPTGELTEYYSFIKADMIIGNESVSQPASNQAEPLASTLAEVIDVDTGVSLTGGFDFDFTHPLHKWFQIHAFGTTTGEISVKMIYDAHLFREDYFECSVSTTTSVNINLTFEFTNDYETGTGDNAKKHNLLKEYPLIPLTPIPVPAVPGLTINYKLTVPLNLTISGKVTLDYTAENTSGFTYNTDSGREKIDKKSRTFSFNLEGEAELSISLKFKFGIGFCGEVVEIAITAEGGVKATATLVVQLENITTDEKRHACQRCVDIKVTWFVEVHASLELHIIKDILDMKVFDAKLYGHTGIIPFPGSPEGICFLSLKNDADSIYHGHIIFGFGECKNYQYRLTVTVHDASGADTNGKVTVKKSDGTVVASGNAPVMTHLYNGTYTVSAEIDGNTASRAVVISDAAKEVVMTPSSADGSIEGTVKDAESGDPIKDAVVIISEGSTDVTSCKTGSDGKFTAPVPAGTYKIKISKDNYVTFITNETVTDGQKRTIETSLMINKSWRERKGGFSGTIRDAVSNNPLADVSLALREGWNAPDSEHVLHRLTTDSNGHFEYRTGNVLGVITGLEPGNYTLTATKQGYASIKFNIVVIPGTVKGNQDATMTESVADDVYRIVLTWSNEPSDLDSHYTAMLASGTADHTYYSNDVGYSANLDRDDTDYEGPETITVTDFSSLTNGFAYAVHDFTNRDSTDSKVLSNSGAKITLYKGSVILDTFSVPTDRIGTVWNVFTLDASGTVHTVNSFENISDPDNVGHR